MSAAAPPTIDGLPASPESLRQTVFQRAFPALHHRNYQLYFYGQLVSLVGSWAQIVGQSWLVWTITHSALMLGVIAGVQSLPILLFSLYGGAVTDRVSRRTLLIVTQASAAGLALTLAVLVTASLVGAANPYSIYVIGALAFALGTVNAFDAPARQAFVIELVGRRHLLNAISLNSSVFNAARIVGPAVAGLLIRYVGIGICFYINAASFIPVIAALFMIRVPRVTRVSTGSSLLANVREGLSYAMSEPVVRDIYLTVIILSVLVMSYISILPVFADQVLHAGAAGYSALTVANGVGALVAALTLAVRRGGAHSRGWWIVFGSISYALLVGAFGLSTSLPLSMLLLFVGGWAGVGFLARANTAIQVAVPEEMRGRVMSIYIFVLMGVSPIAAVQLGVLAHLVGAPLAVASEGIVSAVLIGLLHNRRRAVVERA